MGGYPTAAPLHQNLADTPFIPTARILTGEPPVNRKSNPLGMLRLSFSRSMFKVAFILSCSIFRFAVSPFDVHSATFVPDFVSDQQFRVFPCCVVLRKIFVAVSRTA